MKQKIHPTYHPEITVTCSCGNSFTTGSTREKIDVEVCAECHPFYTGKNKLVDTTGRVDRFQQRLKRVTSTTKTKGKKPSSKTKDKKDTAVKIG